VGVFAAGFALVRWVRERSVAWNPDAAPPPPKRISAPPRQIVPPPVPAPPVPVPVQQPRVTPPQVATSSYVAPRAPVPPPLAYTPPAARGTMYDPGAMIQQPEEERPIRRRRSRGGSPAWASRGVAAVLGIAALGAAVLYMPGLSSLMSSSGELALESGPSGSQVFVDGASVGSTPLMVKLSPGPHSVEFRSGDLKRTKEITIEARQHVVERVDWNAKPAGTVRVDSDPSGARVLLDGVFRGTTPTTLENVLAGNHNLTLETPQGTVRRTLTVGEGQSVDVNESISSGYIAVFAPFDVDISEGTKQIRLDDQGRAMLTPGSHKLRFRNPSLGYDEVRTVEVKPRQATSVNLIPQTTISITANQTATVTVDGAPFGSTPMQGHKINIGTRTVVVKNAAGDERKFTITATAQPVRLEVDFSKPQ
jgi:hypothetical protein